MKISEQEKNPGRYSLLPKKNDTLKGKFQNRQFHLILTPPGALQSYKTEIFFFLRHKPTDMGRTERRQQQNPQGSWKAGGEVATALGAWRQQNPEPEVGETEDQRDVYSGIL